MANSHPFVALQAHCQMAAVLKGCSVYRGNGSLQAHGLLGILKTFSRDRGLLLGSV